MGATIMFFTLGHVKLVPWICRKSFSSYHFPYNQNSSMKWDKHGHSYYFPLFLLFALQSCSPLRDTRYWCFGFARKAFPSTILLIINVHPWKVSNLDTLNNPHSFHYGHYNHILHFRMHSINALDLQKKKFSFHHFPYNWCLFVEWDKLGYLQ